MKTRKSRIGKIARLPERIRDELNHRLDDGAAGLDILAWLNSLPEVRKILAQKFAGYPISSANLSQWRHGGYMEWVALREDRVRWQNLIREECALCPTKPNHTPLNPRPRLNVLEIFDRCLKDLELGTPTSQPRKGERE